MIHEANFKKSFLKHSRRWCALFMYLVSLLPQSNGKIYLKGHYSDANPNTLDLTKLAFKMWEDYSNLKFEHNTKSPDILMSNKYGVHRCKQNKKPHNCCSYHLNKWKAQKHQLLKFWVVSKHFLKFFFFIKRGILFDSDI